MLFNCEYEAKRETLDISSYWYHMVLALNKPKLEWHRRRAFFLSMSEGTVITIRISLQMATGIQNFQIQIILFVLPLRSPCYDQVAPLLCSFMVPDLYKQAKVWLKSNLLLSTLF